MMTVEELRKLLAEYDRGELSANWLEMTIVEHVCQDMMDGLRSTGQYGWNQYGCSRGPLTENVMAATFHTSSQSFLVKRKATFLEAIYNWLMSE